MGAVVKKLYVKSGERRKAKQISIFFDSGSPLTFVGEEVARRLGGSFKFKEPFHFKGVGDGKFISKEGIILLICLEGFWVKQFSYVVKEKTIDDEILIGQDFMQLYKVGLNMKKEKIIVDKKHLKRVQKIY